MTKRLTRQEIRIRKRKAATRRVWQERKQREEQELATKQYIEHQKDYAREQRAAVRKKYNKYLRSPEWEKIVNDSYQLFGDICEICQVDNQKTCVHHNSYKNLYNENIDVDLIVLCVECHHYFHNTCNIKSKNLQESRNIDKLSKTCTMCAQGSYCKYQAPQREIFLCRRCYKNFYFNKLVLKQEKIELLGNNPPVIKRKPVKKKEPKLVMVRKKNKVRSLLDFADSMSLKR
tara:strand:- start:96 stop:791 length:696 start_codon:yes stop_codon:yes gene_type:complete